MESLAKEGALGSVLLRSRMITEEDIRAALDEQEMTGCRFGEALVKLGIVAQQDIDWALSSQLNIPYVRLKPEMIDKKAVEMIPGSVARKYNLIPIFRDGDEISIALADPLNGAAIEAVEKLTGCRVVVSMPIMGELREMLDIYYGPADKEETFGLSSPFFPAKILAAINKDTDGARFLDFMLFYIIRNKLSSVSLQPLPDIVSVIGKQGRLTREIGRLATDYYPDLMMQIRKRAGLEAYTGISAKGVLEFIYERKKVFFQVLTLKGQSGEYVTLKIHIPLSLPGALTELGLPAERQNAFREMASLGQGMVLFGSGSREESCSMIDLFLEECDTADRTVMILGDGPGKGKKRFPRIYFRNIPEAETESAIAAVLDHDPDILVFEAVTDSRIFAHAGRAAARGKLVLCGISCRDTAETLEHLIRFRHNTTLLSHIRGVISLRMGLVPCLNCAQASGAGKGTDSGPHHERGCSLCGYTGFVGRKFLVDIVPFTSEFVQVLSSTGEAEEALRYLESKGCGNTAKEWNDLVGSGTVVPAEFCGNSGVSG